MKQVLIVDDESRLLKSIEAGLKSYQDQFSVLIAYNGKEAVSLLSQEQVDLVVTDLRMPEMDGFELLAYISNAHPFMPSIVMTAFATPEIEERLSQTGTLRLLEKPIDFEKLAETISEGLQQESKEGSVAGFTLSNFLQLLNMEQKTCLLNIKGEETEGYIYLDKGEIRAAVSGSLKGEEALYPLLADENVRITFKKLPKKKVAKMINQPLISLLMEGMRRQDEKQFQAEQPVSPAGEQPVDIEELETAESPTVNQEGKSKETSKELITGGVNMGKVEDSLAKLSDIDGFMAAGIFTPNGEMAAEVNNSGLKLAEIGSLANDVLLKAQKATDVMNVGRGNVVHVEAPQAHVFARCLNENTDFSQSEAGKAHVHMVMLLSKDGNMAMGKMKMESVIQEIASTFR